MKEKILPFLIGLLVGAIIATGGFLIYSKTVTNNGVQPEMMQMNGEGQMQPSESMEEPPEKPDGYNNIEPPTKPEDANNNTNS